MKKIGMCCACGGSFSPRETVMFQGMEMCRACVEMAGWEEGAK